MGKAGKAKRAKKVVKRTVKSKQRKASKTSRSALVPVTLVAAHLRFDRAPYDPLPGMDLDEAIMVATSLLLAKPDKPSPAAAEEAARLAIARDRANVLRDRHDGTSPERRDPYARPFDVAMDRAWETFVRRVRDYAELPFDRHPDVDDAKKAYAIVHDLSILELNYLAEFAQIGARIDDLRREGLLESARTWVGTAFVDEVIHCHAAYGKALDARPPHASSDPSGGAELGNARLALTGAIGEYVFQLMAQARAGRKDTWEAVTKGLEPIAMFRAERADLNQRVPKPPPTHPPVA
jgi:hypothetical protein